nr:glycosyltransferase family 4 protein [Microbacterium sp. Yaish 1]
MVDAFASEAEANPGWKPFLQGAALSVERRSVLEAEISHATDIVVPSTFAKRTFVEAGVESGRVHVMSLGASMDHEVAASLRAASSHKLKRRGPLRVLFAGQVNQRKGISYLLDAAAMLGKAAVSLQVAGPCSPSMRRFIEQRYDFVDFLGTMPRATLMARMADADLLVLPSLAEGFGLVGIEAMLVGTPAIVSEETFAGDVVTDNHDGWIVPSRSSSELASIMWRLFEDRTILEGVGAAAAETASRFTWGRYEDEIAAFLDTACSNG